MTRFLPCPISRDNIGLCDEGLVLSIRRGKTDQRGYGRKVGIHHGKDEDTCPVRALGAWLQAAGIRSGPVFRAVDCSDRLGATRLSDRAMRSS